jgi:hypothetical protein
MPSLRRPALLVAAVVVVLAAGCGGSSSDKKANEAYADSVCTAVGDWKAQIQTIATDFSGGISKASLQSKLNQAEAATKTLVAGLKAVPPPDTDEGKAAKQQLSQFSDHATSTVDSAKSALSQLSGNASAQAITAALASFAPQVQSLVSQAKSTVTAVKSAGGALASAFKSTDSCKNLT